MSFNENFTTRNIKVSESSFENTNSIFHLPSNTVNVPRNGEIRKLPTHPFKFFFHHQGNHEICEKAKELYLFSLNENIKKKYNE
uniref:Uncharacterized protein n=1 Tax=Strongyloides papillosus TaxID=174720 RepID=A0A0N5BH49_STREA